MLKIKYKNLYITFDNHTDLIINKDEFDKLFNRLDLLLDRVKIQSENNIYTKNSIAFVRLNGNNHLGIYVGVDLQNNPYLLLYNTKTKEVSNEIPNELFIILNKDIVLGNLEDKIKNLGTDKYKDMISDDIYESIKDYIERL